MENTITTLFTLHFGETPHHIEQLPASGSARKYYRIFSGHNTYIGTHHLNPDENRLFIRFTRHFKLKGLHVPEIYCVTEDQTAYIQEDLGQHMLLDQIEKEKINGRLCPYVMELYRKSLSELLRFQFLGNEGMDYSDCTPRPVFDRRCILWDLNYFKYCFLRLAGANFSEELLENDFETLAGQLCKVPAENFMFRDFQSRNIMVRHEEVWFIDYQGGRKGAPHYDVASLLYDAIAGIPDEQREELLDYYLEEIQSYQPVNAEHFRRDYYRFVLIRLLQAMGAFGLRGLYEHKQHFTDSIRPGLLTLASLFKSGRLGSHFPEIRRVIQSLT